MRRKLVWFAAALALAMADNARADSNNPCPRGMVPRGADSSQGPQGSDVRKANQDADSAADRVNRDLVGNAQQNQNEREAEAPRPGDCVPAGAQTQQKGDEKQQPAGRTSMQRSDTANDVGRAAADTTGGVEGAVRETTRATDHPGHYEPFAIEYDPLGLFLGGRVSFNMEWAPATHHVIQLSPHIVHTTTNVATGSDTTMQQAFSGVGTELGYRYYTGHRGMNGVFVGPSLILGFYDASLPSSETPFTDVGIAADVGVQEILWDHLVVGGGAGIEYLQVSHDFGDLPTSAATIASSGFKPRLLLEVGYGF